MALYELLLQIADNPVVALNHAVAVAMARGPQAGLELVAALGGGRGWPATTGCPRSARTCSSWPGTGGRPGRLRAAAGLTTSLPQQRYLNARAARLAGDLPPDGRSDRLGADVTVDQRRSGWPRGGAGVVAMPAGPIGRRSLSVGGHTVSHGFPDCGYWVSGMKFG